ncbi:MAG: cbb3-type cytochrome oxidase assembly protein CcoS [Clostridia bacterium]|nr:cbb3-type cytochrome oxidase assembly protein CcoS [Clostridia bacterium]
MSIIFLLIIISLALATGFLIAFIRAARSGQFDDHYTPSVRMLWDDDEPPEAEPKPEEKPENEIGAHAENVEGLQQSNKIKRKKETTNS